MSRSVTATLRARFAAQLASVASTELDRMIEPLGMRSPLLELERRREVVRSLSGLEQALDAAVLQKSDNLPAQSRTALPHGDATAAAEFATAGDERLVAAL